MCASPLEILMSPEAPSDDMPVRNESDPVSPLSPAFDVAITNSHGTAPSEQVADALSKNKYSTIYTPISPLDVASLNPV